MPTPERLEESGEIYVHFSNMPPDEEVLYYAKKLCAAVSKARGEAVQWTIRILRRTTGGNEHYQVVVASGDRASACVEVEDPSCFIAVRNAFAILEHRLMRLSRR